MEQSNQQFDPPPPSSVKERLVAIEAVIPHLATKADIARLEGNLGKQMLALEGNLEKQMRALENRLIKWFVGTAIAVVGVFLAAQIGIAFLIIRAVSGG